MTIAELILELKKYPSSMKVCVGVDVDSDIDLTTLEIGTLISENERLERQCLSLW